MGNTFSKPLPPGGGGSGGNRRRQQTHNNAHRQQANYSSQTRTNTAAAQHMRSQAFHDQSPTGRGGRHGQSGSSK